MSCRSDHEPAVQEWRQTIEHIRKQAEERLRRLRDAIVHSEKTPGEILEESDSRQ